MFWNIHYPHCQSPNTGDSVFSLEGIPGKCDVIYVRIKAVTSFKSSFLLFCLWFNAGFTRLSLK